MIRKLHTYVSGACCQESNDNLMFQEVLLPGTLYIQLLRVSLIFVDLYSLKHYCIIYILEPNHNLLIRCS